MKYIKNAAVLGCILAPLSLFAQLSPPGLDGTRAVAWGAVGFSQALGKKITLIAYGGLGRLGDPTHWAPLQKPGIGVYNQEFQYKLSTQWQASLAQSFRVQNLYSEDEPYEAEDPSQRFELRYYARLYYKRSLGKLAATYSFRPEVRTFYAPSWEAASRPLELRFRLKGQVSLPLDDHKANFIIGANEILTALDEYRSKVPLDHHHTWSTYHFTEDRLALYFRHVFRQSDVTLDVGVMEQFKSGGHFEPVSYLAFDVLFQNPFSRHIN
ncbi:DUF2490 domain-containing protein [Salmonirosea aquatica]|uniref:DUF2490 domain-containing protein n=1 Tax=Salmonirosea aquatica TaxID=2654236 RepID=A0A7C9FZG6_9BACT|nr:DUF2490 domain-containing protein [Cytophagaceae bacterium SJW1-29]